MIKKCAVLFIAVMLFSAVNAQDSAATQKPGVKYDFIWINGGLGAGGVVSTNIINSGGVFLVGNDVKKANSHDSIKITTSNFFANAGLNLEAGIRPVFLFVKPYFEFKSYGSFHKELIACITLGVKFKLLTEEEKARRAAEKAAKKKK